MTRSPWHLALDRATPAARLPLIADALAQTTIADALARLDADLDADARAIVAARLETIVRQAAAAAVENAWLDLQPVQ